MTCADVSLCTWLPPGFIAGVGSVSTFSNNYESFWLCFLSVGNSMGFNVVVADKAYKVYAASHGSGGYCVGQCANWILDILEQREASFIPPDVRRGAIYQHAYTKMWAAHSGGGKAANMYQLKAMAYSAKTSSVRPDIARTIKDEIAATNEEGRRLMDQLLTTPGYVFLLMTWGDGVNSHAIAMLKLNNGNIFLYDPNCGVLEHSGPVSGLYEQVKLYVLMNVKSIHNPEMYAGLLLSTTHDLKMKTR